MIRYRKPRAHIGTNDPEQLKQWAKEFPGCNWGIEVDRSCFTVLDLPYGQTPNHLGLTPLLVTATSSGVHCCYQDVSRDPISDEPEILQARIRAANTECGADAGWFWLNPDHAIRVRSATLEERNIEEGITVTIVRRIKQQARMREFWMIPDDHVDYVLKYGAKCLVDRTGIVMPGSLVDGERLVWPLDASP
jgi:hypothetical protein